MIKVIISLVIGYLFGSIPNAVIVSKLKKVDIKKVGNGNPGAGNVFREVGVVWGILTFILDAAKAVIPMLVADRLFNLSLFWTGITGLSAVVGHCYSMFLGFKGGKGVASSGGVLIYLFPKFSIIAIIAFFLIQKSPRNLKIILPIFTVALGLWLWLYWNSMDFFVPFVLIFITIGILLNKNIIKEMVKGGNK
jgi:glycerol-3-phosphate acyltransferase PlsY